MTKLEIKYTSQFKKDVKLAKKQHRNLDLLFDVINKLADGKVLEEKYKDHELTGKYTGIRECHVEPDWLLVYEQKEEILVLMLYRVGTHSSLFKK